MRSKATKTRERAHQWGHAFSSVERAYGQRVPIIVDAKGRILDGVHRWKICGSDVKTELWKGKDVEIPELMLSLNLKRRHLGPTQKAIVVAQIRLAAGKLNGRPKSGSQEPLTQKGAADLGRRQ